MAKKIKISKARKAKCEKCIFSEIEDGNNIAECHRFPPDCDGRGKNTRDAWPIVPLDGWCGEYKAK